MLDVFNNQGKKIGTFKNYSAFLSFIEYQENPKLLEDSPSFGIGCWSFEYHSPECLQKILSRVKPGYLTLSQLKVLEKRLGLVEICRGDYSTHQEIPVTFEIDVEELRKQFCLDYCSYRRWRLIDSISFASIKRLASKASSLTECKSLMTHRHRCRQNQYEKKLEINIQASDSLTKRVSLSRGSPSTPYDVTPIPYREGGPQ